MHTPWINTWDTYLLILYNPDVFFIQFARNLGNSFSTQPTVVNTFAVHLEMSHGRMMKAITSFIPRSRTVPMVLLSAVPSMVTRVMGTVLKEKILMSVGCVLTVSIARMHMDTVQKRRDMTNVMVSEYLFLSMRIPCYWLEGKLFSNKSKPFVISGWSTMFYH